MVRRNARSGRNNKKNNNNTAVGGSAFKLLRSKQNHVAAAKTNNIERDSTDSPSLYLSLNYVNKQHFINSTIFLLNRLITYVDIFKGLKHITNKQTYALKLCLKTINLLSNTSLLYDCYGTLFDTKTADVVEGTKNDNKLQVHIEEMYNNIKTIKVIEEDEGVQNDNNDGKPESNKNIINKSPRRKLQHQHRKLHFNIDQQDKNNLIIAPMPPMLRRDKDLQFRIPTRPQTSAGTLKHLGNERRHRIENNKRSRRSKIYF